MSEEKLKMQPPICDYCNHELTEFGAILFSDPKTLKTWMELAIIKLNLPEIVLEWIDSLPTWELTRKFHVCKKCYQKLRW